MPLALTRHPLRQQIAARVVAGVDKQRQPEADQLREGEPCGEEAVPVEVAQSEEGSKEVARLGEGDGPMQQD